MATEREIARQQYSLAGQTALSGWTVRLKDFPHPALNANSIVGQVIGPFLFAASMFSYVPVVSLPTQMLQEYNFDTDQSCSKYDTFISALTSVKEYKFLMILCNIIFSKQF